MSLAAWTFIGPFNAKSADALGNWDYMESKGTGKGGFSDSASQDTREFIVKYSRRFEFMEDLRGYTTFGSGSALSRTLPDQHPTCPNFWAQDVSYTGEGKLTKASGGNYAEWTFARVTCNYKFLPFDVLADDQIFENPPGALELQRYVHRRSTTASEYMQVSNGAAYKWVTDAAHEIVQIPLNKPIATGNLQYTWVEVPANPTEPWANPTREQVTSCMAKVNSEVFDGMLAGTCIFLGCEFKLSCPRLSTVGGTFYDITYTFAHRDNGDTAIDQAGWNYLWDARNNRWDLVTSGASAGTSGGNKLVQSVDLNDLFRL